jgi:hypothetical protein
VKILKSKFPAVICDQWALVQVPWKLIFKLAKKLHKWNQQHRAHLKWVQHQLVLWYPAEWAVLERHRQHKYSL